jgi:hypothetical protein
MELRRLWLLIFELWWHGSLIAPSQSRKTVMKMTELSILTSECRTVSRCELIEWCVNLEVWLLHTRMLSAL